MYKHQKFRWLSLFLAIWFIMLAIAPTSVVFADDDDEDDTFSLYEQGVMLSKSLGKALATNENGDDFNNSLLLNGDQTPISTGQSSSVVGYSSGKAGFLFNLDSNNAVTVSLDQLHKLKLDTDGSSKVKNGATLDSYVEYGLALRNLGLDGSVNSVANFSTIFDKAVYATYWLANAAPAVSGIVVKVLQLINPFVFVSKFMENANQAANQAANASTDDYRSFADSGKTKDDDTSGKNFWTAIYPVVSVFGNAFHVLQDMAMLVLIPLVIGFFVFAVFLLKQPFKSTFGRLLVRMFIMVLGVPLVGSVYTQTLSSISDGSSAQSSYFTRIVYTNYLDFRSWAMNTRLGIPSELSKEIVKGGKFDSKGLDEVTLTLNAYALNDPTLLSLEDNGNPFKNLENTSTNEANTPDTYEGSVDALFATASKSESLKINSSDYEGIVKAEAQHLLGGKASNKAIYNMFTIGEDVISDKKKSIGLLGDTRSADAKTALTEGDADYYKWDIYNAGALGRSSGHYLVRSGYALSAAKSRGDAIISAISKDDSAMKGTGLTPLGMYNYLNTDFNPSSMDGERVKSGTIKLYSPGKSTNSFTRVNHRAVLMTGTGMEVALKYVLIIVTFLSLASLQIAVVIAIFKLAVSKLATMFGGIIGATLGSITAFIKLCASVLVTLGVVVGSLALYNIYAGILVGIFGWIDAFIQTLSGTNNLVGYMIKLIAVFLFVFFAFQSIIAVSKNLAGVVDEIIQKVSMTFEQNWARNAGALGTMGNPYGYAPTGSGMGGFGSGNSFGGSGAGGRGSKEDSPLAKAADNFGLGGLARSAESINKTADVALEKENDERRKRGEKPLKNNMFNKAAVIGKLANSAVDAERQKQRDAAIANGESAEEWDAKHKPKDRRDKMAKTAAQLGKMALTGQLPNAMIASREREEDMQKGITKSQQVRKSHPEAMLGITDAGFAMEHAIRNAPGFDQDSLLANGLREMEDKTFTAHDRSERPLLADKYGHTSQDLDDMTWLLANADQLKELNKAKSGLDRSDKQLLNNHDTVMSRLGNRYGAKTLQSDKGLSNLQGQFSHVHQDLDDVSWLRSNNQKVSQLMNKGQLNTSEQALMDRHQEVMSRLGERYDAKDLRSENGLNIIQNRLNRDSRDLNDVSWLLANKGKVAQVKRTAQRSAGRFTANEQSLLNKQNQVMSRLNGRYNADMLSLKDKQGLNNTRVQLQKTFGRNSTGTTLAKRTNEMKVRKADPSSGTGMRYEGVTSFMKGGHMQTVGNRVDQYGRTTADYLMLRRLSENDHDTAAIDHLAQSGFDLDQFRDKPVTLTNVINELGDTVGRDAKQILDREPKVPKNIESSDDKKD